MRIAQLAPDVAAKIAAGEVVERPAAVVKELVENALDAGAGKIRVELVNGGLQLIEVSDDGRGIPAADLPLAFARHATSKISGLADLEQIQSLGFRGEALASIGSVARVTVTTRFRDDGELGAELSMNEGRLGQVTPAAAVMGTSIKVRDLFASVPARLKFLKSRSTEVARAVQVVEQYALCYPEVRFTLHSEGKQVLATPGDGRLFSALVAVYGLRVAEAMVPLPDSPPVEVTVPPLRPLVDGSVSRPSCYKSTRQAISLFVNRRWVQSRTLTYAVEEAYHSLLLAGRHPIAVVNISIDPALVDVNVHPAKTEVKFLHERMVYAMVQRSVRAAVLATAEAPEVSSRAFSATGPSSEDSYSALAVSGSEREHLLDFPPLEPAQLPLRGSSSDLSPSEALLPPAGAPVGGRRLPVLRVLGQVFESYIIAEGPDGLFLVDQHAAHERILLERMISSRRSQPAVSSQLLLQPLPLELSADELEAVLDHLVALQSIGFDLEEFGDSTVLLRALPGVLAEETRRQSLLELLLKLVGADREAASHGETWEEHALANVACKAAIKAGQALSLEEQRELIRQLEGTDARQSCCHGRPTMVHISFPALERQFDRR